MTPPVKPEYSPGNPFAPPSQVGQPDTFKYSQGNPFAQQPNAIDRELMRRSSEHPEVYSPEDEFADEWMKQTSPMSRLFPKFVRLSMRDAVHENISGMVEFAKRFANRTPTLEDLRNDLVHWDESPTSTVGSGMSMAFGAGDLKSLYGNRETLERLIHTAIIARANGKELTKGDMAMAYIPPVAAVAIVYSAASRLVGGQGVGAALVYGEGPHGKSLEGRLRDATTALASGTIQLGTVAAGGVEGAKLTEARFNALRESVISTPVELNQAAAHVESVNTFAAIQARLREGPSLELEGIRDRLMAQDRATVTSTLVNAHRDLTPEGTTIIPGVQGAGQVTRLLQSELYRRGEEPPRLATYLRPDGSTDVALYGEKSPLMEPDNLADFQRFGYFYGQEVSVKGVDAVFLGMSPESPPQPFREFNLRKISSGENFTTTLNQIRRKAVTQSGLIKTEFTVGHEPVPPHTTLQLAVAGFPKDATENIANTSGMRLFARLTELAHQLVRDVADAPKWKDFNAVNVDKTLRDIYTEYNKHNNGDDFNAVIASEAKEATRTLQEVVNLGRAFTEAHHRLPVFNEVQMAARRAAVAVGKFQFDIARANLEFIRDRLERGPEEWKRLAGDVHQPAKVETFETDSRFERRASRGGLIPETTLAFYNRGDNTIYMRPRSSRMFSHPGERSWESILSHEVAHAHAARMIKYNPELASEILDAARRGNTDLANGGVHQETVDYIKSIDDRIAAGQPTNYTTLEKIVSEAVTEELSHRYPVTPLKEMFTSYRTEFRRASLDDVYRDFKDFNHEIMTTPRLWEGRILDIQRLPDTTPFQRGPLAGAMEAAKRYFTKEEIVGEFKRKADEQGIPYTEQDIQHIEYYGQVVEHHSLVNNFERQLQRFADSRGIPRENIPGLNNYIGQKMARELREQYMRPEERERFDELTKELAKATGRDVGPLETLAHMEQLPLATEAATNGYRLDYSPNSDYVIRGATGVVHGRFYTETAAREFINRSGQNGGPSLTPSTNIPDQVGGAAMPPSGGKLPPTMGPEDGLTAAYDPSDKGAIDKGVFGKITDIWRTALPWLTGREAMFESVDNLYGSHFNGPRAELEAAKNLAAANASVFKAKYLDHIGPMLKGLSREQFANVFRYIEAKSPGELIGEMLAKGRKEAVDIAHAIADLRVDTSRAIEFSRKVESIKDDMKGQPQDAINMEIEKLRQAFGFDNNHVVAAGVFEGLRKRDINVVPIMEIARLADALMWDSPGRDAFAKLTNMSAKELLIAHQFDNLYEQASKITGIPDFRLISGYINHIRSQLGGDIPSPEASVLFQKGLGGSLEEKFIGEFVRTGELSVIELNPFTAALRYIDTAFKSRDFTPVFNKTMSAWDAELVKLTQSNSTKWIAKHMAARIERYASDIRGHPAPTNALIRSGITALNKHLGSDFSPTFVEDFTKRVMQLTSSALLAFRPYIGLRHLAQFETFAGVRFGFKEMHEGLRLAEQPGAIENLKNSGVMSGLSFTALVTPEESAASMLAQAGGSAWKAYEKFAEIGHAATLLPTIYEHTYAAVYLGMRKLALDNLNKLSKLEISKLAAYDNMSLDSFAPSFRAEFDGMVRAGRVDEAAALIAKRAAKETIFDYQSANAPQGWNSVQGRFLTMFGTWSVHASELVTNMVTRGSLRHRVNYMARFAMAQSAVYLAGRSIGIDLLGSTVAHSLFWTGSPQAQLLQTTVTAINGQGVEQRLAQDRLFKLVPGLKVTTTGGERRFEFDFNPDLVDPRSMFIPGSYALGDWMQAIREHKDPWGRYTLPQQAGRFIGAPTIKYKSWVDDYMEQLGLHFYDYTRTVQQ